MSTDPADWPQTHPGWPGLTTSDPVVDGILRDLFVDAHGPATRVELVVHDRAAALAGDDLLSWSIDGVAQERVHLGEVLFRAVGLLNRHALEADPTRFHLHAALVGDAGRAVLIPGVRGAGKTTLTSALIDRGWAYGTDEMVAVERGGAATSLRKPLNCKPGSLERFEHVRRLRHPALAHWPTDRAQLGVAYRRLPAGPVSITDIVVPLRSNRYASPHLAPLPAADAVRILVENSFDFERHGADRSLETVARLVRRSRTWMLLHNDATSAAAVLAEDLTNPWGQGAKADSAPPDVVTIPALDDPTTGPHVRRSPGTHGVAFDGYGVIWVPDLGRVVQVTPPAFAAWATADGTTELADRAAMLSTSATDLARVDDELAQAGALVTGVRRA